MEFEKTFPVSGDSRKALAVLRALVEGEGYDVLESSTQAFRAKRRRRCTTNKDRLSAVSEMEAEAGGGALTVRADLGGVRSLGRSMCVFLLGLASFLTLLFWVLPMHDNMGHPLPHKLRPLPFIIVSPWIVIGPLMMRSFRANGVEALEDLVRKAISLNKIA